MNYVIKNHVVIKRKTPTYHYSPVQSTRRYYSTFPKSPKDDDDWAVAMITVGGFLVFQYNDRRPPSGGNIF